VYSTLLLFVVIMFFALDAVVKRLCTIRANQLAPMLPKIPCPGNDQSRGIYVVYRLSYVIHLNEIQKSCDIVMIQ